MTNKDILIKINEKTDGDKDLNQFIQKLFIETEEKKGRYENRYMELLEECCPKDEK